MEEARFGDVVKAFELRDKRDQEDFDLMARCLQYIRSELEWEIRWSSDHRTRERLKQCLSLWDARVSPQTNSPQK